MIRRQLLPLAALAAAGCYTYTPAPSADIPPGREIRASLTDAGSVQLGSLIGPRAAAIEGRFAARTDTTITVSVSQVTRFDGSEETWRGERVIVPRSAFAAVQRRQFSRARTAGLTGTLLAAAVLAVRSFGSEEGIPGGGTGNPGPGTGQ